jgi:hypothetical protein
MDQLPTLQQLEYLETRDAVSKTLAQAGFSLDQPVFSITWGQIAEEIATTLADYGLPPDQINEDFLVDLAQGVQKVLQNDDVLFWRCTIRAFTTDHPTLVAHITSNDDADDEGPLTELYENATRLGDDETCWPDAGRSADWFNEF